MGSDKDNRESKRTPVAANVKLRFSNVGSFLNGYAANLSETGMFVETNALRDVGTPLLVEIIIADRKEPIEVRGEVVWVREKAAGEAAGMGIRFKNLSQQAKSVISHAYQLHQSLGGELVDWTTPHGTNVRSQSREQELANQNQDSPSLPSDADVADQFDALVGGTIDFGNETAKNKPDQRNQDNAKSSQTKDSIGYRSDGATKEDEKPGKRDQVPPLIIGIDLGTTNSCVAYCEDGVPKIIPSSLGYTTIPSMVALNHRKKIVVGQVAFDQIVTNPENTVYGSKRLVGRPYSSPVVQQMKSYFTYDVVEGEDHLAAVKVGDQVMSLPQVSAHILGEIKDVAEGMLEREITDAVISVPAFYNDNQRNAVKKAGELAGLKVRRIINEPTAAALAYGFNRNLNQKVLIYDLGGGTFDVSVLEVSKNQFKVIATGGDTFLGGADFDRRLIFELIKRFKQDRGYDLTQDKVALQRIKNAAEKAKKDLSFQEEVTINLPYIGSKDGQPIDLQMSVSRKEMESLTTDLIQRTLDITNKVIQAKDLAPDDIDRVLLVGGQTRMPLVRKMVEAYFSVEPTKGVHPDEVVALGTALLAASLNEKRSTVNLVDVLSMPIGIAIPGGRFKPIIDKNTPLPFRKDYKLSNAVKGGQELEIDIYQGESSEIMDNEYLGTFRFDFGQFKANEAKTKQLAMTFLLDQECILTIVATDMDTKEQVKSKMTTSQSPKGLDDKAKELAT